MSKRAHELWLGTEAAFADYTSVMERYDAGMLSPSETEEPEAFQRFDLQGNLAIIPVKGSLSNRGPEWLTEFGVTPYSYIRNALVDAAECSKVETILLDVDSGGGSASGVSDIGELIRKVNSIKPVAAYTGGHMASAAYWIGAAAGEIAASPTAEVGSIGVIATHMSIAKMLENEGVDATVIRAGKYKALASPYEPLSEEAKSQIQGQLDTLYGLFVDHVAQSRNMSAEQAHSVAEGREFIGRDAKKVGLVDKVAGLDTYVNGLVVTARERMEARKLEGSMGRRKVLMEEAVAAIAEGASVEAVLEVAPEVPEVPEVNAEVPEVPEVAAEVPEVVAEVPVEAEVVVPEVAVESAAPAAPEVVKEDPVIAYLQADLKAKDAEIIKLASEKLVLEQKLAGFEATHVELKKIVEVSINHKRIALGGSAMDLSDLPAETVLQEYAKVHKTFCETYPIGGVASIADKLEEAEKVTVSPMDQARRRAVKV
jgi:signal peptide peptidase SppA